MDGRKSTAMCNDGSAPLRVPGLSDISLHYQLNFNSRFSTPFDKAFAPNITAREMALLRAINDITDQRDWAAAVLRDDNQQKQLWRAKAEACSTLIDEHSWQWILRELYDKATAFSKLQGVVIFDSGAIGPTKRTLDASKDSVIDGTDFSGFSIFKSDSLLSPSLLTDLKQGTMSLFRAGLNCQVNPSLYPLVFNRSPVFTGQGVVVSLNGHIKTVDQHASAPSTITLKHEAYVDPSYDEEKFQWLPCEVQFRDGEEVAITSYINNLDYECFGDLYHTIEKILSLTIEPWNQVLVEAGRGRTPLRILTYGVEYSPRREYRNQPWVVDEDLLRYEKLRTAAIGYIESYCASAPSDRTGSSKEAVYNDEAEKVAQERKENKYDLKSTSWDDWWQEWYKNQDGGKFSPFQEYKQERKENEDDWKSHWGSYCRVNTYVQRMYDHWARHRTCPNKHPLMGQQLTYDAWKAGNVGACVVPPMGCDDVMTTTAPFHAFSTPPPVSLRDKFRSQGLQVVVKLVSIELTPTSPKYIPTVAKHPEKMWNVEGAPIEHIVAVTSLCYSVENIKDPQISFRHNANMRVEEHDYDPNDLEDLVEVLAFNNDPIPESHGVKLIDCYLGGQVLGSVKLRPGRLLSYPNHLMTKMEACELEDKSKPGHVRSLILCLVDPNYRLCSTRNVPPQQQKHSFDKALRAILPENISLRAETRDELRGHAEGWPLTAKEAQELSEEKRDLPALIQLENWGTCTCQFW